VEIQLPLQFFSTLKWLNQRAAGLTKKGANMAFVQIIEYKTSKFDEIKEVDRQWMAATEGKRRLRRQIVTSDRKDPNRYLLFAFFDSYEEAMENSALPETEMFSARYADLVDGPIMFHDLDVLLDEMT
jgi:hypothetical protein